MNNSIKQLKALLVKFFSIVLVAGLMASCASSVNSGISEVEPEKTTVNSDNPDNKPMANDDEMDPIITDPGPTQGR